MLGNVGGGGVTASQVTRVKQEDQTARRIAKIRPSQIKDHAKSISEQLQTKVFYHT